MDYGVEALQALARSNVYGLLARVTGAELDAETLAAFRSPAVLAAFQEAGIDLTPTLTGADDAHLLAELATAYSYVFLLTVSPHASVQCGEGRLWGDRTVAANDFLEEAGLVVTGESSLLPDHVSMELAVMQRLTADEAASLAAGNAAQCEEIQVLQRRYLQEHLGPWGVRFFHQAEQAANHAFYRQVCALGHGFLHTELTACGLG